ncbi:MAG: YceI family protein [Candidatus Sulfotelmatobacter sp.]
MSVDLDPAATTIEFTLGATMHTVHGTFKLKSGHIVFDPKSGNASGSVIVDATSANTGNSSRDKKMHAEILQSRKFPEIVFTPTHEKGEIAQQGTSSAEVSGIFRLCGQDRPATLSMTVDPNSGRVNVSTAFAVPYIKWGLKNPSTFLLRVSDTVNLQVHTTATISGLASGRE